jgi:hypothetical protein
MTSPHDPFTQSFDSIEIDPARAPSKDAIERALAMCAPTAAAPDFATPGFHLADDAGGRFIIDREFGVVSLKDEALLERERNAVYAVRLHVVEVSGLSYDLDLKLRLTGRVQQVVGAEDFAAIAALTDAPIAVPHTPPTPAPIGPRVTWNEFAAVRGAQTTSAITTYGPFGAILRTQFPAVSIAQPVLNVSDALPAPGAAGAAWSL